MMKKLNLLKSVSLVSFNRILSCVLGFSRDVIWARYFGVNSNFDAFVVAFNIPSFISYILTEALFVRAFLPMLTRKQVLSDSVEVKQYIANISGVALILLLSIVILSIFFAQNIVHLFAPGFSEFLEKYILAVRLFQLMAVGILFLSLGSLFSVVLNAYKIYGWPSITPILFNVSLIFASLYLRKVFDIPVYALGWGVLVGSIIQVFFLLPILHQQKLFIKPQLSFLNLEVKKTFSLAATGFFGVSAMQLGVLINYIFASYLVNGSVGWLYYATRLTELPVTIFGVGIATVVLPRLGRSSAVNDQKQFQALLDWSIRSGLFISVPATLGLFFLAGPIVSTLFQQGLFSIRDAIMTEKCIQAFAYGMIGLMFVKVGTLACYARQTLTPLVVITSITVLINTGLNWYLSPHYGAEGIAAATAFSVLLNALMLIFLLLKKKYYYLSSETIKYITLIFVATLIMWAALFFVSPVKIIWFHASMYWKIKHLLIDILVATSVYLSVLHILMRVLSRYSLSESVTQSFLKNTDR